MDTYFEDAIAKIYGDEDDFIIIGLTGQTGSGCSTVANILSKPQDKIKHSLYKGTTPEDNTQRKQKIIFKCFEKTWAPFITIQASSILTLMLSDKSIEEAARFIGSIEALTQNIQESTIEVIKNIQDHHSKINNKDINSLRTFYTEFLPSQNSTLKKNIGGAGYVALFQTIGNNVRNSGNPTSNEVSGGNFFSIAERINKIIKEILKARKPGDRTYIVIDAIRNPFEAIYFQDRYSSFYLMAVSCEDEQRKARLRALDYTDAQIEKMDKEEYGDRKLTDKSTYIKQDIQACLQRSDLYISNPNSSNTVSHFSLLANQIITFVCLMIRPGLITPTPLERCMQIAYTAKLNSGCISRQVGAVVTDKNFSIQAVGWNDTPFGQVPCSLRNRFDLINGSDQNAYSEYEKTNSEYIEHFTIQSDKYKKIEQSGRNISYCFKSEYNSLLKEKNQVHTRSLHAEENAFLQLSKYGGRGIEHGKLFTTASPCELCSKKAYQLGIKEIYYIDPYPGIAMSHILMGGTNNPDLILFSGAIGKAFHNLYSSKMPYKDELNALASQEK